MSSTSNIEKFLMPPEEGGAYTDEKLAALLAHAQDGKLAYCSCCCLIGIPNANHALQPKNFDITNPHYLKARSLPNWNEAAGEFYDIGKDEPEADIARRRAIIPLILAEMDRRERKKIAALPEYEIDPRDEEPWSDTATRLEQMNSIKGR